MKTSLFFKFLIGMAALVSSTVMPMNILDRLVDPSYLDQQKVNSRIVQEKLKLKQAIAQMETKRAAADHQENAEYDRMMESLPQRGLDLQNTSKTIMALRVKGSQRNPYDNICLRAMQQSIDRMDEGFAFDSVVQSLKDPNPRIEADLKTAAFIKCMIPEELNPIIRSYQHKDHLWATHPHTMQRVVAESHDVFRSMELSPNGKYIALECFIDRSIPTLPSLIRVIEIDGLREILTLGMKFPVYRPITWSADSRALNLKGKVRNVANELNAEDELNANNELSVEVSERMDLQGNPFMGVWQPGTRSGHLDCYIRVNGVLAPGMLSPSKNIIAQTGYVFGSDIGTIPLFRVIENLGVTNGNDIWPNTPIYRGELLAKIKIEPSQINVFPLIKNLCWSAQGLYFFANVGNEIIQVKPVVGSIGRSLVRRKYPLKIVAILGSLGMLKIASMQFLNPKNWSNIRRSTHINELRLLWLLLNLNAGVVYGFKAGKHAIDLAFSEYGLYKKWQREKA